jgi:DNA modification methylase
VWGKENPTPFTNNVWLSDLEYCLYFRESGVKLNDGYELKSKWHISPINIDDKNEFEHPTIKPLELVKRHILHASQLNDVILDCFIGSGTTAVASKELGRQYIGIEIDEKWHKIAVDRVNGVNARGEVSLFADFDKIEIIK